MSGNIGGRSKQVVATTFTFVSWAAGNAIGPQVFRANDGPRYLKAFITHMVCYGIQLTAIFILRIHLMRLNVLKRRAQGIRESTANAGELEEDARLENRRAFDDLTDKENPDCK